MSRYPRWPALVDRVGPALGRAVGADRRRMHQRRHGLGGGREHAPRPLDVDPPRPLAVARGLDRPGEMDYGRGPVEVRVERVPRHVRADPGRLRRRWSRGDSPRDRDDRLDPLVAAERRNDAGPDVAGRSGDDDLHTVLLPRSEGSKPAITPGRAGRPRRRDRRRRRPEPPAVRPPRGFAAALTDAASP